MTTDTESRLRRCRHHAGELLNALPEHWTGTRKVVAGWLSTLIEPLGPETLPAVRDLDAEGLDSVPEPCLGYHGPECPCQPRPEREFLSVNADVPRPMTEDEQLRAMAHAYAIDMAVHGGEAVEDDLRILSDRWEC